tara:strand:- start:927 stop:1712 length:786 start_codon:yes stop_codon:yes gene_type:complete
MPINYNMENFISFANNLADESEKIIMNYFRKSMNTESKQDNSPVTVADKKSEEKIRMLIKNEYPSHGIIGEEYERVNIKSEFTWVIDPIDGTRSFVAGHKDFGTLIALLYKKEPILGIINCPAHNERWVGRKNHPTTYNGNIVKTSKVNKIEDSYLFTSGLYLEDKNFREGMENIIKQTKFHRFGGDCYMYGMVTMGLIDIVIEDTLKIWDYMALIPVIQGAGGIVTDKFNKSITYESQGSLIVSANKELHSEIMKILTRN